MTREQLKFYKPLVAFLGEALGPDYEIVLHDLEDENKSVIAIANGHISGRKVGDPITDKSLGLISNKNYQDHDFYTNYKGLTTHNSVLRSSTFFIKNDEGIPVGLLCINFDDSRFIELHDLLLSVAHPIDFLKKYSTHTLQNMEMYDSLRASENITENLTPDINELMHNLYQTTVQDMNIPMDRLTQEERISVVKQLNEQGFFKLKGAVQYAARQLFCSTASIYRYLNELKNNPNA